MVRVWVRVRVGLRSSGKDLASSDARAATKGVHISVVYIIQCSTWVDGKWARTSFSASSLLFYMYIGFLNGSDEPGVGVNTRKHPLGWKLRVRCRQSNSI